MAVRPGSSCTSGTAMATICRASSALMISGGTRRITRVGGDADQQPGLRRARPSSTPQGRSSSMPIIRPGAADLLHAGQAGEFARQRRRAAPRPRWRRCASRPSSSMMRSVSTPARMASGLPPKVVPWLPGPSTFGRLRAGDDGADRHARAQALGQRHHVGLDAGPLVREPLAGAADAALHLVEHQQPVALVAQARAGPAGSPSARR